MLECWSMWITTGNCFPQNRYDEMDLKVREIFGVVDWKIQFYIKNRWNQVLVLMIAAAVSTDKKKPDSEKQGCYFPHSLFLVQVWCVVALQNYCFQLLKTLSTDLLRTTANPVQLLRTGLRRMHSWYVRRM